MPTPPAPLALLSPAPESTLSGLSSSGREVAVVSSLPERLAVGGTLLIGPGVDTADLVAAAHLVAASDNAVLALDLSNLSAADLTPDLPLTLRGWERWGTCTVALLAPGTGPAVSMLSLAALADAVSPSAQLNVDRVRRVRERIAMRDEQIERLRNRVVLQREQLAKRTKQRDLARSRVQRLRSNPDLQLGRQVRALIQRLGGKRGLALLGGLALVVVVALVAITVAWPALGYALLALAALGVVVAAAGLCLYLAQRTSAEVRALSEVAAALPPKAPTATPGGGAVPAAELAMLSVQVAATNAALAEISRANSRG